MIVCQTRSGANCTLRETLISKSTKVTRVFQRSNNSFCQINSSFFHSFRTSHLSGPHFPVYNPLSQCGINNKQSSFLLLPSRKLLQVHKFNSSSSSSRDGSKTSQSSPVYDRNFITGPRALSDFCLTPEDLKGLRVTTRRSPIDNQPPLHVYWRKDVEDKSLEIWGSIPALENEIRRRIVLKKKDEESLSYWSQILSFLQGKREDEEQDKRKGDESKSQRDVWPIRRLSRLSSLEKIMASSSGKVVLLAIGINSLNFGVKGLGAYVTGSHALFSEAIHSLADTMNQIILAYGIHKSTQSPTHLHPYGYSNMQYVSSLISGTGIFCLGAGVSVYHGVSGLTHPVELSSLSLASSILFLSLISESFTLFLAIRSTHLSAKKAKMTLGSFVSEGTEPSLNVVLLEDIAAVTGVVIAGLSMSLSLSLQSPIPDAVGSILIGGLLASVASFMIFSNTKALVGRSISQSKLLKINALLEGDVLVRQVHDVKGIDMGNGVIRYKAELDIDGRELTRFYLRSQDLKAQWLLVSGLKSAEDFEDYMLSHGENIVDCLGEQVDRIERELRAKHPEVRHMDLEVL